MIETNDLATVSCFLLKVASRCNINCDYCYMYNHLDQSYKLQPKLMSEDVLSLTASRIKEYVIEKNLKRIAVVYHGGEPLLLGTKKLVAQTNYIKSIMPEDVTVEFSLQTNGVLLKESDIMEFESCDLQVSLSLDGPQSANDRHRLDHQGKSSYQATENALILLQKYPKVFSGVIAVIDAQNDVKKVLNFFAGYNIPQLDFLLPDANYLTPPPLRTQTPNIYSDWLIQCFDIWFDSFPELKIRTFDSILAGLLGAPSETDGFGFGDVGLITIETDGSYHDLDVLKITGDGTNLGKGNVANSSIKTATESNQVQEHRRLLKREGLSMKCQKCPIVEICGGGAVAHRFGDNGFDNPSIYCHELESLILHISERMNTELEKEIDFSRNFFDKKQIENYELNGLSSGTIDIVKSNFMDEQVKSFKKIFNTLNDDRGGIYQLHEVQMKEIAILPSVVVWTDVMEKSTLGLKMKATDGTLVEPDASYLSEIIGFNEIFREWPQINRPDKWLRSPFGQDIYFENLETTSAGQATFQKSIELIERWKPELLDEMKLISPEIQYIRDPKAHTDQIVSFSDNSVPGALYVQLIRSNDFIDPCDLADSIIHEHRHQKLYLLQRMYPIVVNDSALVQSPWRAELRPPSGLFHALYVFTELLDFWNYLKKDLNYQNRADKECLIIIEKLNKGFITIENCELTECGIILLNILKMKVNSYYNAATQ